MRMAGHRIMESVASGRDEAAGVPSHSSFVALFLAACLIFIYYILLRGLPRLYIRKPGSIPTFYKSLLRRSVPLHFIASTFLQSYFLSAPLVARSWLFLFSSQHLPNFLTGLLLAFSIAAFILLTRVFATRSLTDGQWILPIFSFASSSILHPRWAQLLWSISRIGLSLPWVQLPWYSNGKILFRYSPFLSALLSRSLWLYLGMFDLLIGVGAGLALMQALPRQHVLFVSTLAQVFGAMGMIAARATLLAPGRGAAAVEGLKIVPQIFPDFTKGIFPGLGYGIFWFVVSIHVSIATGWIWWYRKAQLQKP